MTIQEWGAIGEVVGGVAVVLSLLYLAYQIRQSTKMARASARQEILDKYYETSWEMAQHPHLQRVCTLGLHGFDSLSNEDKTTFSILVEKFGGNVYNALLLRRSGLLDEETFRRIGGSFVSVVATPGGQQWWQSMRHRLYPLLLEYVDNRLSSSDPPQSVLDVTPLYRR